MSSDNCKAIKKSGEQCKLKANSSGYCHIHDPEKISERESRQKTDELVKFEIPTRTFSQRRGFKAVSEVIQIKSMSQELRISLWNVLSENFLHSYSKDMFGLTKIYNGKFIDEFFKYLWIDYFKLPLDRLPEFQSWKTEEIYAYFQKFEWNEVYDFLEVTINYFQCFKLVNDVNFVLERELAGYRFVGTVFTEITNEQEIEMLENVIDDKDFPAVATHLRRALTLMSDRENPDYRNSIKESISAVESLAKFITNKPKATLGEALKILESSNNLHPALKSSFLSLYGYTSDEGGIRHGMLDEPNLTVNDAKFFWLSCTSFINYLKSKMSP